MVFKNNCPAYAIALRTPVIFMVLAATAIPVELRPPDHLTLSFDIYAYDFLANIIGYVPVGIVLGKLGFLRAALTAALLSIFAESSQVVMAHRDPTVVDIGANVLGAVLGILMSIRRQIRSPRVKLERWKAVVAIILALVLGFRVWTIGATDAVNAHGTTMPGTLEAYWRLDEPKGNIALDSSGHDLQGRFSDGPARVAGVAGRAVEFDGVKDYIDFGHSTSLRIIGSMTISAWINSSAFPADDATIVSNHISNNNSYLGYQLDTTIDSGPRTIGFKLADVCGAVMARYGATPLKVDTWYYVTGLYNAEARTLDVYLNGKPDSGFLSGAVTSRQRHTRSAVTFYMGKRPGSSRYNFAGSIDDVRIYSRALTEAEIAADMHGRGIDRQRLQGTDRSIDQGTTLLPGNYDATCDVLTEEQDKHIPVLVAASGVLAAFVCVSLLPLAGSLLCAVAGCGAGLLLLAVIPNNLPAYTMVMLPLLGLTGGLSVAIAIHRQPNAER